MKSITFSIPHNELEHLLMAHPNLGKNIDVGNFGVGIAKHYLENQGATDIIIESAGVDIQAKLNGKLVKFEVKATTDNSIAFSKLKVSSSRNHDLLVNGMEIMRICKVGQQEVDIHFLKHGEDFTLVEEPRWRVKKV